jgi:hypothetical protein
MIIPPLSRFKRFDHNYFKHQLHIPWFFKEIAPAYIFSRVGLILVGVLALATLPLSTYPGIWQFSSNPFINMWSRWDAIGSRGVQSRLFSHVCPAFSWPRSHSGIGWRKERRAENLMPALLNQKKMLTF